jgi:hypothetical protein
MSQVADDLRTKADRAPWSRAIASGSPGIPVFDQWNAGLVAGSLTMLRRSIPEDPLAACHLQLGWPEMLSEFSSLAAQWVHADEVCGSTAMGRFLGARVCLVPANHQWRVILFSEGLAQGVWLGDWTRNLSTCLGRATLELLHELTVEARGDTDIAFVARS